MSPRTKAKTAATTSSSASHKKKSTKEKKKLSQQALKARLNKLQKNKIDVNSIPENLRDTAFGDYLGDEKITTSTTYKDISIRVQIAHLCLCESEDNVRRAGWVYREMKDHYGKSLKLEHLIMCAIHFYLKQTDSKQNLDTVMRLFVKETLKFSRVMSICGDEISKHIQGYHEERFIKACPEFARIVYRRRLLRRDKVITHRAALRDALHKTDLSIAEVETAMTSYDLEESVHMSFDYPTVPSLKVENLAKEICDYYRQCVHERTRVLADALDAADINTEIMYVFSPCEEFIEVCEFSTISEVVALSMLADRNHRFEPDELCTDCLRLSLLEFMKDYPGLDFDEAVDMYYELDLDEELDFHEDCNADYASSDLYYSDIEEALYDGMGMSPADIQLRGLMAGAHFPGYDDYDGDDFEEVEGDGDTDDEMPALA